MGRLVNAIVWARDQLVAADISAAIEPADLNLPGVIVYPQRFGWRLDAGEIEAEVELLLIARQVRALDALAQLDDLAERVAAVLPVGEFDAVMVSLSSQSADVLPALRTTCTLVSNDD